jgi:hypothetical protein
MNELTVIEKLDKFERSVVAKRETPLFPIPAALRKELNELKKKEFGNLLDQIRALHDTKSQEYCKLYAKSAHKEAMRAKAELDGWNKRWITATINLGDTFKELREQKDNFKFPINEENDYDSRTLLALSAAKPTKFVLKLKEQTFTEWHLKKEFEVKYGAGFEEAKTKIRTLEEKFNEALVFADLELVKEIYYTIKKADVFLKRLSELRL